MKISILGASRGVGRELVELALADGHEVTALARRPETIVADSPWLRRMGGDVLNIEDVSNAVTGQDVVCCTLGADRSGATTLYSSAATTICRAMVSQGTGRLLFLSNFGVLDETGTGWKSSLVVGLAKSLLRDVLEDHRKALAVMRDQPLDWTAVRPMLLTNGPHSGLYRVSREGLPANGFKIARRDVADFILREAIEKRFVRGVPALAY